MTGSDRTANAEPASVLIDASALRLGYGGRTILDNVRWQVRAGEFWFFVGANGAGKTTLFKAILGTHAPRSGSIQTSTPRERIGYVPQRCDFDPALPTTVREFILLGLVGLRLDRAEQARRLSWALERVGLRTSARSDYWSLSGGQRQRALVARALVRQPLLVLADEPTNGMDLAVQDELLRSLADLNRTDRLTLVFIAHDLSLVRRYGTHVALFHDRRVLAGTTSELLTPDNLHWAFGLPPDRFAGFSASSGEMGATASGSP